MNKEMQPGHCKCGCGEKTKIAERSDPRVGWIKGQPKQYINGHQGRARKAAPVDKRFWSKVDKRGPNDCWEWQGCVTRKGYGFIKVGHNTQLAHRVAWILLRGAIEDDLCCLHSCDNPKCVNPNHIFLGTREDNNLDRKRKGRGRNGPQDGSNNNHAKLTWDKVEEIRRLFNQKGISQGQIARRFNITQPTVSRIVRGLGWIQA